MPVTLTSVSWDATRQRYVTASGKTLTHAQVRKLIDAAVTASSARLKGWAAQMQAGKLSVPKWQALMAREVKNVHAAVSVIANGGRNAMTPSLWGKLGADLKFQFKHLRDFALAVPRTISDRTGSIPPRAEMYGTAAIGSYENAVLERNKKFGLSIARRVMARGVDSCDVCIDEDDLGWQDINEIRAIGDSPCMGRCNCRIEYEEVS